jgi:hypothetical protein
MKVGELVAALVGRDPEAEVFTEGCDCTGDVEAVVELLEYNAAVRNVYGDSNAIEDGTPAVVLVRSDSHFSRTTHP